MTKQPVPYFRMLIGFIFGFTMSYSVQFIGTLKLGEILAIPILFSSLPLFFTYFKRDKLLQYSLITLTCWIAFQLASDSYNGTDKTDLLKGIANLVVAASTFMFLIVVVRKDVRVLLAILFATALGSILLRNFDVQTSDEIYSNEFWDLQIAGWAGPLVLFVGIFFVNRMRLLVVLGFLVYGAAAITYGGRSHGMFFCFAAISTILLPHVKQRIATVSRKKLTREIVVGVVALTLIYPVFVYIGLQGHITSKTQQQLNASENPYNPFQVIIGARRGVEFGATAIKRRPIAGYGSRAYKGDFLPLSGMRQKANFNSIHSIVMESGAFGGIGAMACCLFLLFLILKQCARLGSFSDAQCNLIASYVAISQSWIFLFNPLPSFRLLWPVAMIMIWCVDLEEKPRERFVQVSPDRRKLDRQPGRFIEH